MSQVQNPRDNQALLQSMLQRLKLQNGTTNIPIGQNATEGPNTELDLSDLQTTKNNNSSPVKGFEPTYNIKRDLPVNSKALEVDSPSGKSKDHGNNSTGQIFSPKPGQDFTFSHGAGYNFTTFRTKKDTSEGLIVGESAEQNQDQNSSFVPKVYAWSPKTPELQNNNVSFDGMFGVTGQSTQATNRKQRSSENKTRRWTQKIKEKWRERPGSFGKKKDDRRADDISQENSPQYLPLTTQSFKSPSSEGGHNASVESTSHSRTQTSAGSDEYVRSTNDFDLGLGSFSLLDEIVSGQEWAKFLNPSVPESVCEGPSTETMDQRLSNHHTMPQSIGNSSWTIRTNRGRQDTDIAMTQELPESSVPADITEKSQIQTEPMDQSQSQSDMLITVNEPRAPQPSTKTQLMNSVESSSLRGRNSLSRKRQYHSSERIETLFHRVGTNGNDGVDDGSVFLPDNHAMDDTDERSMNSFPSAPTPCSPVRGVLKPTLSSESANSMETASKKRRMEVTRHVRFSEEIITIDPPELGSYESDSEEEEDDEEDSVLEEDSEDQTAESALFEPIQPEQVAPARRPVLPAWIRALKRRNTGKKPR